MTELYSFENRKINIWAIPSVLMGSWILGQSWFFTTLMWFFSTIPFHEMGHAYTAWLGGRFALPVGAIIPSAALTFIGLDKNPMVIIVVWGVLFLLAYRAHQEELSFVFLSSLALLISSVAMVFGLSKADLDAWISFGGIAGEFALSTFVIVAFNFRSFEKIRWDFFRFPALGLAGFCFMNVFKQWQKIKSGLATLPAGSAMSSDGASDKHGDLNRLFEAGWSKEQIVNNYVLLGKICVFIIVAVYIYKVATSIEEDPRE